MPPIPVPPTPLDPALSPTASPGTGTPIQGGPSTSLTGWNHLMRSIAGGMVTANHRVNVINRATLRGLATGRKVAP